MSKRIKVVLNEKAGRRSKEFSQKYIHDSFKELDPDVTVEFDITQAPRHATELAHKAASDGYDIVVAAGGDGTVNEVVNGLVHTQAAMGIIPNGSGNVFAQEMKLSSDIKTACANIINGKAHEVDVGQVNERFYIWILGIGIAFAAASPMAARSGSSVIARTDLRAEGRFPVS